MASIEQQFSALSLFDQLAPSKEEALSSKSDIIQTFAGQYCDKLLSETLYQVVTRKKVGRLWQTCNSIRCFLTQAGIEKMVYLAHTISQNPPKGRTIYHSKPYGLETHLEWNGVSLKACFFRDLDPRVGRGHIKKPEFMLDLLTGLVNVRSVISCKKNPKEAFRSERLIKALNLTSNHDMPLLQVESIFRYKSSKGDYEKLAIDTPFYENKTLFHFILQHSTTNGYTLSKNSQWALVRDVAQAVFILHNNRFIHRDIKLENYFVDKNSRARLSDFDDTILHEERERASPLTGTYNYFSPECYTTSARPSFARDIWAVGVVAYTVFTADLIPTNDTPDQRPYKIPFSKLVQKHVASGTLGKPEAELLDKIFCEDPDKRITAENLVKEVEAGMLKQQ